MKKLLLLLTFVLISVSPINAETIDNGNFKYELASDEVGAFIVGLSDGVKSLSKPVFPDEVEINGVIYPIIGIGQNAFADKKLTGQLNNLPCNLKYIKAGAFKSCTSLNGTLTFPESIIEIGDSAFYKCWFSTELVLPSKITTIGNFSFYDVPFKGGLKIPEGVQSIGNYAFFSCGNFTDRLFIPNSVEYIGDYAFAECNFKGELNLPDNVHKIGKYAFNRTSFWGVLRIPASISKIENGAFSFISNLTKLELPNSIVAIGDSAFYWGSLTDKLVIPSSVETIGNRAFDNQSFTEISMSNSVKRIGKYAFAHNGGLLRFNLSDCIEVIEEGLFQNCKNLLAPITLPDGILRIEDNAFDNCGLSGELHLPKSVVYVGQHAFNGCGFTSIIFNDGIETIEGFAFASCKTPELILPSSVCLIGDYAFNYSYLTTITCLAEIPPQTFSDRGPFFTTIFPVATLKVPEASVDFYKEASCWKNFNYIEALKEIFPEDISFNTNNLSLKIGQQYKLVVSLNPTITTNRSIVWATSDNNIVAIENGLLQALKVGNATITATTQNGLVATCIVRVWTLGDVNCDGYINVADVTLTSSFIAGYDSDNFVQDAADINEDEEITITDAVMIAQMVLSAETITAKSSSHLKVRSIDWATLDATFNGDQIGLSTLVDNITALQADVVLPQGVTASDIHLADHYLNSHLLMTAQRGENVVRLVVFSPDNSQLAPCEDIILIDTNDGVNVNVENILVSDAQGRTKALTLQKNDVTTSIDEISSENSVRINIIEGGIIVEGASDNEIICYDIYGRISAHFIGATENQAIQLPRGVNIVKVNNLIKSVYIK